MLREVPFDLQQIRRLDQRDVFLCAVAHSSSSLKPRLQGRGRSSSRARSASRSRSLTTPERRAAQSLASTCSRKAVRGGRGTSSVRATCSRNGSWPAATRSEEHTSELQSLMRISYAVFCLKKKIQKKKHIVINYNKQHTKTTQRSTVTRSTSMTTIE